jgi:hypothetical protein
MGGEPPKVFMHWIAPPFFSLLVFWAEKTKVAIFLYVALYQAILVTVFLKPPVGVILT